MNLGIQTYCFRGYHDNTSVARHVKEDLGLTAVELCNLHADFDDESAHEPAIDAYRQRGIDIVGMGVQTFTCNAKAEPRWFEFARKAGASFISADFQPQSWEYAVEQAQKLAEEYDVNVAVHNHGGYHWLGCWQMLDHFFRNAGDRVGLCLDTAWCFDAGEDPLKWIDAFKDRLMAIHIKDFIFDRARRPTDVVVGTGNLDLPALLSKLEEVGFDGPRILEYEGDVENPIPALAECVRQLRS